jgi:hypothetical protein
MSLLDTLLEVEKGDAAQKVSPVSPVSPASRTGPPEAKTVVTDVDTPASAPGLAACGRSHCAGCYEVEPGRRIHPPKPSREWLDWLVRWQKPKGERVQ